LLSVYGAFPALPELQEPYLAERAVTFPSVTNWGLINESLAYAAAPHHESDNPNYARTQQRFADFATLLLGDTGADIDLEAELDALQADLQAIIDEAM
ncbi:MAG: sugar ABC transporter substrate-binding protein, partial [Anaerolineae bacterium]|nr:sugar ABC transporter substrate-binding protein [Anaerolineae bacterium]